MTNIIVSIIYLLFTFLLTVLCFKKYGKVGLYIWICLLVVISNIQTIKLADFGPFILSLGNISYGAIFLSTDILSEKYGSKIALKATKLSFMVMICFVILMKLFLLYDPSSLDFSQDALKVIFDYMPRITLASLIAYYISQVCDTKIYAMLKNKNKKVWIRNNVSTMISQFVDTIIFVSIAFFNTMSFIDLLALMLTMIVSKYLIALLDTPFMYWVLKIKNEELE